MCRAAMAAFLRHGPQRQKQWPTRRQRVGTAYPAPGLRAVDVAVSRDGGNTFTVSQVTAGNVRNNQDPREQLYLG